MKKILLVLIGLLFISGSINAACFIRYQVVSTGERGYLNIDSIVGFSENKKVNKYTDVLLSTGNLVELTYPVKELQDAITNCEINKATKI